MGPPRAEASDVHAPSRLPPATPNSLFTPSYELSRCSLTGTSIIAVRKLNGYKLPTDPFFVKQVRDIVGLVLNPPDKAMVFCV
jgi:hypothetical protein